MFTWRASCLLSTLILTAGCGSSAAQHPSDGGTTDAGQATDGGATDAGSSNDGGPADAIEGRLIFRGLGEGIGFKFDMYRNAMAGPAPITRGDGHCDIHPVGDGDTFGDPIPLGDLDLGATVTATSGSMSLTANVEAVDGTFQYEASQAGVDAFGKAWTLSNSGSATGLPAMTLLTVQVPAQLTPIVPAPEGGMVDTTSGHVTLQWTGGEGAETFHIFIHSANGDVDCYPAPTATSFDLPADVVSMLDPMVTPIIWAETVSEVEIAGRRVSVRVTSDNLD